MMTNEELADRLEWWLAYFDDGTERHPDFADDPYGFDETAIEADLRASASRLREQDGERIEGVLLPDSRLRSMIAGAFRYGTERERAGEIKGLESSYIESEHHANRLVDEFIKAGHITVHPKEPSNG